MARLKNTHEPEAPYDGPSRSSLKRDAERLQELGEALVLLKPEQLASIPLSEELLDTITLTQNTFKKEARRRQLQFIGKLMRKADHEAIATAYHALSESKQREARLLKTIEHWRDTLLLGDANSLEAFIGHYPQCDRQALRLHIKAAQDERARQATPPTQTRKLFKWLRDVIQAVPQD